MSIERELLQRAYNAISTNGYPYLIKLRADIRAELERDSPFLEVVRQYVTAKLLGVEDCRQGVITYEDENSIIVHGRYGIYECEKDYIVVPFNSLWGETKKFAVSMGVKSEGAWDYESTR